MNALWSCVNRKQHQEIAIAERKELLCQWRESSNHCRSVTTKFLEPCSFQSTWGFRCPVGSRTIWLLGISSNFEIWGLFLMLESSFAFNCDHFFRKICKCIHLLNAISNRAQNSNSTFSTGSVTPQHFFQNVQAEKKGYRRVCLAFIQVSALAHGEFRELGEFWIKI